MEVTPAQVLRLAIESGAMDKKQVAGFEMVRYVAPETNCLTMDQVKKIADNLYSGKYNGVRRLVAAYFLVECYGGIRFSDWPKFKIEKLVDNEHFKVNTTKKGTPVYLDLSVFVSLAKVIRYIKSHGMAFNLSEKTANDELKVIGAGIGLDFELTTHDGRRTFATLLGELGMTTRFIADAMGVTERTAIGYIKHTVRSMRNEMEDLRRRGGM